MLFDWYVVASKSCCTAENIISNANVAQLQAKTAGGGSYRVFEPDMNKLLLLRRHLETELRISFRERQLELQYLPISDLRTGEVIAYEALICWQHPTKGLLSSESFMELAEETGLALDISHWALEQACLDAMQWVRPWKVSVNIPTKVVVSQSLFMQVSKVLESTRLPADRLELEIKEDVYYENVDRVKKLFTELQDMGVSISLDEFGAGHSSMKALLQLPINKVKILSDIVRGSESSQQDLLLLRSIIGLAKSIGLKTVALGADFNSQQMLIKTEGCDELQSSIATAPSIQPLKRQEGTEVHDKATAA
ncbi:MAG: EAL domain-containing protein [Rhizobiaceae bacterium]